MLTPAQIREYAMVARETGVAVLRIGTELELHLHPAFPALPPDDEELPPSPEAEERATLLASAGGR